MKVTGCDHNFLHTSKRCFRYITLHKEAQLMGLVPPTSKKKSIVWKDHELQLQELSIKKDTDVELYITHIKKLMWQNEIIFPELLFTEIEILIFILLQLLVCLHKKKIFLPVNY